jgi:hypothetical protein
VADTRDVFPMDKRESVDFDRDGVGDNADADDDNDGVPDKDDAFPNDKSKSASADSKVDPPKPPKPADSWKLEQRAPTRLALGDDGRLTIETGFTQVCPAGGPPCTGRMTLKVRRRSRKTGKLVWVFLAGKTKAITIRPGASRTIRFRLSKRTVRILRRMRVRRIVLRGWLRVGREAPVYRQATLKITLPRSRSAARRR